MNVRKEQIQLTEEQRQVLIDKITVDIRGYFQLYNPDVKKRLDNIFREYAQDRKIKLYSMAFNDYLKSLDNSKEKFLAKSQLENLVGKLCIQK